MHAMLDIRGDPNIGAFCFTNQKFTLVPNFILEKECEKVKKNLGTRLIKISIGGSPLIGCLVAGNSNKLLVPHIIHKKEKEKLKENNVSFEILESKFTALGNLILANRKGAIISPKFGEKEVQKIKSSLNTKVSKGKVAGLDIIGSAAVATNHGALVHPNSTPEEINLIKNELQVEVKVGTVNFGTSFPKLGILANDQGTLIGSETIGPELITITNLFG